MKIPRLLSDQERVAFGPGLNALEVIILTGLVALVLCLVTGSLLISRALS